MSFSKKQRKLDVIDYQYEYILKYVGDVSKCKAVSKIFVPKDYVTCMKFDASTPVSVVFKILSGRSDLKILDFTGSYSMNESILHVILMLHPNLDLIVLDRCDRFDDFPSFSCEDEINLIQLSHNSRMKWRNVNCFPVLSFRGCWKLFESHHNQNPLCITNIVMRALNNASEDALDKIPEFCVDRIDWIMRRSKSFLVNQLKLNHEWNIRGCENFTDRGYVLMDVIDFSLVIWIFFKKRVNGKSVWCLLGIWKASIYRMWKLCKLYSQM